MGLFDELRCALIRKRALLHSALCARRAVQKRRRSFEQMGLRSSSNSSALHINMAWVFEFLIWEGTNALYFADFGTWKKKRYMSLE